MSLPTCWIWALQAVITDAHRRMRCAGLRPCSHRRGGLESGRVQQFTSGGTFLQTWGTFGTGPGQFTDPHGVAVYSGHSASGGHDSIYVTDPGSNRVQEFYEGTSNAISCAVCN